MSENAFSHAGTPSLSPCCNQCRPCFHTNTVNRVRVCARQDAHSHTLFPESTTSKNTTEGTKICFSRAAFDTPSLRPLCQSIWSSKVFPSPRGASPPTAASPPGSSCARWLFRYLSAVRPQSHAATGAWIRWVLASPRA